MQEPVTVTELLLQQVVDRLDAIDQKLEQQPVAPPSSKKKSSPRAKSVDGL